MALLENALLKSLWVFHVGTGSCNNCDIEMLDCLTPRHDVERFGMVPTGSMKHADVLLVTGAANRKCIPRIKRRYDMMPKSRLVVAISECALLLVALHAGLIHTILGGLFGLIAIVPDVMNQTVQQVAPSVRKATGATGCRRWASSLLTV